MADKKITELEVSQTISQSDKVIANVGGSAKQVLYRRFWHKLGPGAHSSLISLDAL